jgi:hypothetical protein
MALTGNRRTATFQRPCRWSRPGALSRRRLKRWRRHIRPDRIARQEIFKLYRSEDGSVGNTLEARLNRGGQGGGV